MKISHFLVWITSIWQRSTKWRLQSKYSRNGLEIRKFQWNKLKVIWSPSRLPTPRWEKGKPLDLDRSEANLIWPKDVRVDTQKKVFLFCGRTTKMGGDKPPEPLRNKHFFHQRKNKKNWKTNRVSKSIKKPHIIVHTF